jgi:pimeloyl-ACP methyl ester carboxylesterase
LLVSGTVYPVAAQAPDAVRGRDLAAAVNFSKNDLKADGRLFLPERVSRVRAVIAVTNWGLGGDVYADQDIRSLAASTDSVLLLLRVTRISTNELDNRPVLVAPAQDAVLTILRRFAEESGRPEIATAPLLFWGHSQGGNFGAAFAALHPERTIAFVLYQSAAALSLRTEGDIRAVAGVPALIIEGITEPKDAHLSETLWSHGRSLGAPWAFLRQSDAPHGNSEFRKKANGLLMAWARAVLIHRVVADKLELRPVADASAWIGDNATGEMTTLAPNSAANRKASWLPDEPSARAWRSMLKR